MHLHKAELFLFHQDHNIRQQPESDLSVIMVIFTALYKDRKNILHASEFSVGNIYPENWWSLWAMPNQASFSKKKPAHLPSAFCLKEAHVWLRLPLNNYSDAAFCSPAETSVHA